MRLIYGFMLGLLITLVDLGHVPSAIAARKAWVDVDEVELREGPSKERKSVWKLHHWQSMAASNYPTQGFYKVRTRDGVVGWVPSEAITFQDPMPDYLKKYPPAAAVAAPPANATAPAMPAPEAAPVPPPPEENNPAPDSENAAPSPPDVTE